MITLTDRQMGRARDYLNTPPGTWEIKHEIAREYHELTGEVLKMKNKKGCVAMYLRTPLSLWVSEQEKSDVLRAAKQSGMSTSAWVREVIETHVHAGVSKSQLRGVSVSRGARLPVRITASERDALQDVADRTDTSVNTVAKYAISAVFLHHSPK